jgi:hypothetical protein
MSEAAESPIVVALLFALRCLVPLLLMLGVSYLLKRLGLIAEPPQAPSEENNGNNGNNGKRKPGGGVAHGKV